MEHFVLLNKTPIKIVQTVTKINSSNVLDHVVLFASICRHKIYIPFQKNYHCRIYYSVKSSDVCMQFHISMMEWTYCVTSVGKLKETCTFSQRNDETCDVGIMSLIQQ